MPRVTSGLNDNIRLAKSRQDMLMQGVQEYLCFFEISGVKTLGEAAKNRREQFARVFPSALVAPHPREAGGGA